VRRLARRPNGRRTARVDKPVLDQLGRGPTAIFDTGLDVTHPEFSGRPSTTLLNPQVPTDSSDDWHGTAVDSVAAALRSDPPSRGTRASPGSLPLRAL